MVNTEHRTSRRALLRGAAAAIPATLAGPALTLPMGAATDPVLPLVTKAERLIAEHRIAHAAFHGKGRRDAGGWPTYQEWNDACQRAVMACREAFQTPAQTTAGALAKLRILDDLVGPFCMDEDSMAADYDLTIGQMSSEVYPNCEADISYIGCVIADLERLAGRVLS